jgi:hypothetical protein
MRKLILISAFLLVSVSAQAGESRSLAANDEPAAATTTRPAEVQPEATKADVKAEANPEASKPEASKPETSKTHASRPAKKVRVRGYEGDEAKARRIAARYGVYW